METASGSQEYAAVAVAVVVIRPLSRDGSMAEDHGASEAGATLRAWTRGRREIESRQRSSDANSP